MKSHKQFSDEKNPPRPCNVHDLTFGGHCFNCGYNLDVEKLREKGWTKKDFAAALKKMLT